MAAGFFADVVATPLWVPAEVISTRLQIQGPGVVQYENSAHAARHIVATEGVAGLFRGLTVSIVAFGPASAVWWGLYQATNRSLTQWRDMHTADTRPEAFVGRGPVAAEDDPIRTATPEATRAFLNVEDYYRR